MSTRNNYTSNYSSFVKPVGNSEDQNKTNLFLTAFIAQISNIKRRVLGVQIALAVEVFIKIKVIPLRCRLLDFLISSIKGQTSNKVNTSTNCHPHDEGGR